jgi:heat shock protein HslJ
MTRNSLKQLGRIGALGMVAVLVLAACGSSDPDTSNDDTTTKAKGSSSTTEVAAAALDLDGKAFTATGVEGYEPVPDSQLTLTFQDGSLSVNAGCNTMTSTYEVTGDQLAWTGTPAATMMGCADELMNQDTWLINLFTEGVTAALEGEELTLTSDDVTITLSTVPDAELVGTAWALESTMANEAVSTSAPPELGVPTLKIAEDGSAQVFTGCNTGSTTVEVTDTTLTFAPLAMTRMFCEDAADLETAVTTVLDGETTYVIDGTTLTITKGDTGLVYTATTAS